MDQNLEELEKEKQLLVQRQALIEMEEKLVTKEEELTKRQKDLETYEKEVIFLLSLLIMFVILTMSAVSYMTISSLMDQRHDRQAEFD